MIGLSCTVVKLFVNRVSAGLPSQAEIYGKLPVSRFPAGPALPQIVSDLSRHIPIQERVKLHFPNFDFQTSPDKTSFRFGRVDRFLGQGTNRPVCNSGY